MDSVAVTWHYKHLGWTQIKCDMPGEIKFSGLNRNGRQTTLPFHQQLLLSTEGVRKYETGFDCSVYLQRLESTFTCDDYKMVAKRFRMAVAF